MRRGYARRLEEYTMQMGRGLRRTNREFSVDDE
jgi:hypothetical protein